YNLCYLRPGASQGARTTDEYGAPVIATMQAGLGRTAAFTGQVSGKFQVDAAAWPEVANLLVTVARWISAQSAPQQFFTSVQREGREAVISVDVDRENSAQAVGALTARMVAPDGSSTLIDLVPVSADRFEARVPIGMEGVYRFAAATEEGEILKMDPLAIPYSPEFEPRMQRDGGDLVLGRVARLSGGRMNPATTELLRGSRKAKAVKPLAVWFAVAGLLLMLMEISWRRLFEGSVAMRVKTVAKAPTKVKTRAESRASAPAQAAATAREKPKSKTAPAAADLDDALSGAKRRASRRTKG
ncbi:MAG: hypothetical protein HQ519_13475, partial [Planctomycetes bacterium]|nr:hypothetical protein [Planctomycetota bacterium]